MAKSALVAHRRRKRRRRNPDAGAPASPRSSSKAKDFFLGEALPAFAAYATTRLAGRIVYTLAARRFPRLAKHLSALSGVVMLGAAWYGSDKWKRTAPYQGPLMLGAAVAALQGIARTYVPKYGWIVTDPQASEMAQLPAAKAAALQAAEAEAAGRDEYSYLEDEMEAAGAAPESMRSPHHTNPADEDPGLTPEESAAYNGAIDIRDSDADPMADFYSGAFAN